MTCTRIVLAFLLAACAVPGCIAFPIAVPEETPFKDVAENYFIPGASTVEDVRGKLGEPAMQQDDWWLYRDSREGWQWAFCAGGAYSAGCDSTPRTKQDFFFVVDFDADGIVTQTSLLRENELCDTRRLCFEGEILMRAAPQPEDDAAKQFRVPPADCLVFTYSATDRDSAAGYLVIDGEKVGELVGTNGYFAHTVAPGPHAWLVVPTQDKLLPHSAATTSFYCSGRQVAFLRYSLGFWSNELEIVDAVRGQRDIRARWLAVTEPEYGEMMQSNWLRDDQIFVTKRKNTVTAYQLIESEKVPRWGVSETGEPCGMRAALEDYGLTPLGAEAGLQFGESIFSVVEVHGVCRDDANCAFRSVIDGEVCNAVPATDIEFQTASKLLVLEAGGDAYTELYFGDAARLKKLARCEKGSCTISIERLRESL